MKIDIVNLVATEEGDTIALRAVIEVNGVLTYHRTSILAQHAGQTLREVDEDLVRRGWGHIDDADKIKIKELVGDLFTPGVDREYTEVDRPAVIQPTIWQRLLTTLRRG